MASDKQGQVSEEHLPGFEKQDQEWPGQEHKMTPRPDYGYESYKGHGRLQGKKALVTGGDSGIGRAIALAFAREGADVAISYLNEHEDAKEIESAIKEAGREVLLIPGDLEAEEQVKKVVDQTVQKFGQIDILVNNAAVQLDAIDWTEMSRERLEKTFKVNIIGYFSVAQKAVAHMKAGGSIINIASIQAYKPNPQILDYACTKGAIVTFTKGLGSHLFKEKGIRVNCIAPGPVWTPLIVESFPEEKVASFGKGKPADRPAQPKEYQGPAVFLACQEESSYVSGAILGVTGGDGPMN
jgi:NAD(P)-dependent dehydrogenase (short-subunit alcohol dehydrogenase family)